MSDSPRTPEVSPKQTYRVMMGAAIVIGLLIAVAIFSLSRLSPGSMPSFRTPSFQSTLRKKLPIFESKSGNRVVSNQTFAGRWTLLTFWSITCPPCLVELPELNEFALNWQGPSFEVMSVNVDKEASEDQAAAKEFLLEENLVLPVIFDGAQAAQKAFDVEMIPTHFLVNPEGLIIWQDTGLFSWKSASTQDALLKLMESNTPKSEPVQVPTVPE